MRAAKDTLRKNNATCETDNQMYQNIGKIKSICIMGQERDASKKYEGGNTGITV